jgi:hypothetical protein
MAGLYTDQRIGVNEVFAGVGDVAGSNASYAVATEDVSASFVAHVSPLAAFAVALDDIVFSGGAVVSSEGGRYDAALDGVVFSGGASVSPVAAFSATLADVVWSGSASGLAMSINSNPNYLIIAARRQKTIVAAVRDYTIDRRI